MHRTFVLVKRDTQEPDGVVSTYLDRLEDFDYNRETHELMLAAEGHPVFHEQLCWQAPRRVVFGALWDRQLVRKPQEQIDAEDAERTARQRGPRGPSDVDLLLNLVNALRAKNGDLPVTLKELRNPPVEGS
jgi:hypothetical protein